MGLGVSVVIANYNYGRFLGECIESVLAQTYAPIDVIVVDDGSTDNSREVLARYGSRVHAILQPNRGQSIALGAGVAAARGDLVCLLDSDDWWKPDKIRRVVDVFTAHPDVSWLRHKLALAGEHGTMLGGAIPAYRGSGRIEPIIDMLAERVITVSTSAIVLRREAATRVFPLPNGARFALDADAILLARLFFERCIGYSLDETLGYYRRHSGQTYVGRKDLVRMLNRQIEVTDAMCEILGISRRSTACFKHQAIIAALEGSRMWEPRRAGALLAGLCAAAPLLSRPRLFARQVAGLLLAGIAPAAWLRRLERAQQFAATDSCPQRQQHASG